MSSFQPLFVPRLHYYFIQTNAALLHLNVMIVQYVQYKLKLISPRLYVFEEYTV